jgi:hypothetical protein
MILVHVISRCLSAHALAAERERAIAAGCESSTTSRWSSSGYWAHHPAASTDVPDHLIHDMDGPTAEETRRNFYDMAAAEKALIAGFHFPFPSPWLRGEGWSKQLPAGAHRLATRDLNKPRERQDRSGFSLFGVFPLFCVQPDHRPVPALFERIGPASHRGDRVRVRFPTFINLVASAARMYSS